MPSAIVSNACFRDIGVLDLVYADVESDGNSVDAGEYIATVTGLSGLHSLNYILPSSPQTCYYRIDPKRITPPTILDYTNYVYDGSQHYALEESGDHEYYSMTNYKETHAGQYY